MDYKLPKFNQARLLKHIDKVSAEAPGGVVQFIVDLFCGAGGFSEGAEQAKFMGKKNTVIIAGINHDKKAIYSQAKNHPLAYYTDEDIRFAHLEPIIELVNLLRQRYPNCPIFVWSSLECTNHSNAKGGLPRDPDSRALPWEMYRYIEAINPDGIWFENVKEFAEWGPMMPKHELFKGKRKVSLKNLPADHLIVDFFNQKIKEGYICSCPLVPQKEGKGKNKKVVALIPAWRTIEDLKGTYYLPWVDHINSYGYHKQERVINAADYGVPQNRKRLFIVFVRRGWPINFPHPTHAKSPKKGDMFDGLKPHVPVKAVLDFSVEGRSIFEPGHVTSDKTWERVYEGLIKFIAGGKENFMMQRNGGAGNRVYSPENPARVVTATGGNQELVNLHWIGKYNSSHNNTRQNAGQSINEPAPTITTFGSAALMNAKFLDVIYGTGTPSSVDRPSPTVRTKDGLALVDANFLLNYQGQSDASSMDAPAPTLMTQEKLALMGVKHFIYKAYGTDRHGSSIEEPVGALTPIPKSHLVQVDGFVMSSHYDNPGTPLDKPAPTIVAGRKHNYLVNMSWGGHSTSSNDPSVTIVARQDKAPIYLVSASESEYSLAIPVFENDPEIVVKIKEFMVLYNIVDIKKRMLMIPELLKIQSFPDDYYLAGTQTDKKKFIGNAVAVKVAKAITESMYETLLPFLTQKIAA